MFQAHHRYSLPGFQHYNHPRSSVFYHAPRSRGPSFIRAARPYPLSEFAVVFPQFSEQLNHLVRRER